MTASDNPVLESTAQPDRCNTKSDSGAVDSIAELIATAQISMFAGAIALFDAWTTAGMVGRSGGLATGDLKSASEAARDATLPPQFVSPDLVCFAGSTPASESAAQPQRSQSWYRPPVPMVFGDYLHGSGVFVPSDGSCRAAAAFWEPQFAMIQGVFGTHAAAGLAPISTAAIFGPIGQAALMMGPAMFGSSAATPSLFGPMGAAFAPSLMPLFAIPSAPLTAIPSWSPVWSIWPDVMRSWMVVFTVPLDERPENRSGQATAEPASVNEVAAGSSGGFAAYRTVGGHAAANVVRTKPAGLLTTAPLAAPLLALSVLASFASVTTTFVA